MAQFAKFLLLILCQYIVIVTCTEPANSPTTETSQQDVKQIIVDAFNDKLDEFTYHSPNIINAHRQNESDNLYLIHFGVSADCKANASESCTSSELVCEVLVIDDPGTQVKQILDGYTLCANKETEPQFPATSQGFVEVSGGEKGDLAQSVIQELEENDPQRSVVDIMSLKKLEVNGTLLFLTLKATKNDGGDSSRFEVCEIQLNQTDSSSEKECFSLESNLPNILLSGDDMSQVAKDAVQELDNLSLSKYTYALLDIINAEKIVTPGSEGVMTSLELKIAPSVCLKRSDSDEMSLERACMESNFSSGTGRMICRLVRWDRPWKSDTLYSVPICSMEDVESSTEMAHMIEGSSESISEAQPQPQPVVEEPFVARIAHCTGCPTDLNLDNPALQLLTEQALTQLDEQESARFKHALVRIIKAQKQVVNGVKYILHLEVGETSCPKSSLEDRNLCSVEQDTRTCVFEFLERPWLQLGRELLHSNCTDPLDNNLLDNEIQPNRVSNSLTDRHSIFDYLDTAMDEPFRARDATHFRSGNPSPIPYGEDGVIDPSAHKETPLESSEEAMLQTQPKHSITFNSDESSEHIEKPQPHIVGSRQKREVEMEVDRSISKKLIPMEPLDDPFIVKLGNIAVKTLDELDTDDEKRVLISVDSAKKQLAGGVIYHFEIRLGLTNCPESTDDRTECPVIETRSCYVQLIQNFITDPPQDAQVVKSECFPEIYSGKRRPKRALLGSSPSANDEEVKSIARYALNELDQMSSMNYRQEIVRILGVTQQAAGKVVRIRFEVGPTNCSKSNNGAQPNETCIVKEGAETQICSIKVWDKPYKTKKEIIETKCQSSVASRKKRDVLVGGPSVIDPNSPEVQEMTAFVLTKLDGMSNSPYKHHLVEITNVTRQVVAGTLTKITFRVGHSTCTKQSQGDQSSCTLLENSIPKLCVAKIWDRPWLSQRELSSINCDDMPASSRSKRDIKIGGDTHDLNFQLFRDFMQTYNKTYKDRSEIKKRFHIFRANMIKAKRLQETELGTAKYGATIFADLTAKEFHSYHLGLNRKLRHGNHIPLPHAEIPDVSLPKEFDWRHYNVVTEVKNQGMCGSCWAFSVTGNVEGQYALKYGTLVSLSEQELVDCDKLDEGCNGGLPENAYKAIEEIGGLETETDYPYEGENEKCHFDQTEAKVQVNGGVNITSNETQMAQWLVKNGPISIGINANAMQFYMGGVSHPWKYLCNPNNLDHGVLIVGYGVHTYPMFNRTMPFWTIKNSWGTMWGEQGYYRVYRGDGTCGVNMMATSAIL